MSKSTGDKGERYDESLVALLKRLRDSTPSAGVLKCHARLAECILIFALLLEILLDSASPIHDQSLIIVFVKNNYFDVGITPVGDLHCVSA